MRSLDAEEHRAAEEHLSQAELAVFDLLKKDSLSKAERERIKQASRSLLASLQDLLKSMNSWTANVQTQAEVQVFVLDRLHESLPMPPFSQDDAAALAQKVYNHVWQQSMGGASLTGQP